MASDLDFDFIAGEMAPDHLPSLYRHLKISKAKIQQAEHDCSSSLSTEKAVAVLQMWRKTVGKTATRKAIISALNNAGNSERAHFFEEHFSKSFTNMQESNV